jgi:hypothetical protein
MNNKTNGDHSTSTPKNERQSNYYKMKSNRLEIGTSVAKNAVYCAKVTDERVSFGRRTESCEVLLRSGVKDLLAVELTIGWN